MNETVSELVKKTDSKSTVLQGLRRNITQLISAVHNAESSGHFLLDQTTMKRCGELLVEVVVCQVKLSGVTKTLAKLEGYPTIPPKGDDFIRNAFFEVDAWIKLAKHEIKKITKSLNVGLAQAIKTEAASH